MKIRLLAMAVGASLLASSVQAEMIVINGRYIVAKEAVRGYFYRENTQKTVFDVRWSDWSTQYRCEDTYDRSRIEAASLNLVLKIGEASFLDFEGFLESEGFVGCTKF
ncbi:hypothetical protein [Roseobacter sp. A03A-229]